MKSTLTKVFAALLVAAAMAGCGTVTVQQETTMEWMERQPVSIDGPP